MRVKLELPNDMQTLSPEEQKEKLLQALQNFQIVKTKIEQPSDKQSKWAKITKRVDNDPIHLEGYSDQLKRDMKDFRDNFEFNHKSCTNWNMDTITLLKIKDSLSERKLGARPLANHLFG